MHKSAIARLYSSYIFNRIKNCQNIFQGGHTILHSHQQCSSDPVFSAYSRGTTFYFSPYERYEVVPHCGFDLHFPND